MPGMFGGGVDFSKAADAEVRASQQAIQAYQNMYGQARQDLMPGIQAYSAAMPMLAGMLDTPLPGYGRIGIPETLRQTPGYKFAQEQGLSALSNYAAPRGLSMSGPQMKGIEAFGTGLADQTYQQYINNLMGLAGMGQGAAGTAGGFGMNAASGMANAYMGAGDAQANAIMAEGLQRQSAFGGLLNTGAGILGMGLGAFAGGPFSAVSGMAGAFGW